MTSRELTSTPWAAADNIVINDLSGTDVTEINLNLAAAGGGGDGAADTVAVTARAVTTLLSSAATQPE
jgi:hypothetical protein